MVARRTFKYITKTATKPVNSWSNTEVLNFHYFNDNGVYKAWRNMCDEVSKAVDAGKVPSGWILAYGSLNDYNAKSLQALLEKNRINTIELQVAIKLLAENTERSLAKLAELN